MNSVWKEDTLRLIRFYSFFSPIAVIILIIVWISLIVFIPLEEFSKFIGFEGVLLILSSIVIIYLPIESKRFKKKRLKECVTEIKQTINSFEITVLSGKTHIIKPEDIKLSYSNEDSEPYNPVKRNSKIYLKYIILTVLNDDKISFRLYPELFEMTNFPFTNWEKYNEVRNIPFLKRYKLSRFSFLNK